MQGTDLMGGYAAYTTPNAAVEEMATTGAAAEAESVQTILSIVVTLATVAITVLTN
ncbi:hypothetical protein AB0D49_24620 [Streptomyces sp. NPDC048290]|uniref:hypothetical protein n=1 Tax=Streptomyces sp. NPDC048290 TaxID=3155811 RepID=UPI003436D46E